MIISFLNDSENKVSTTLFFATGNSNKVEEVREILSDYYIRIESADVKGIEIQADTVEEIARASAKTAALKEGKPIFVEDTGFFIEALKGFPGPYASYVDRTIGRKGVLRLLDRVGNRKAEFKSAIAFCMPNKETVCFTGSVSGRISFEERGTFGFGFDPIFEPDGGGKKTFAEMTIKEKNYFSHRARAVGKFVDWYLKQI
ncbi:MAG: XTP/dITP diphosphohydrolase [Thermoproteota archaeon]|nr:XTP/dITP diphosphohydrolase [Thermoproteota archaeon]